MVLGLKLSRRNPGCIRGNRVVAPARRRWKSRLAVSVPYRGSIDPRHRHRVILHDAT